MVVLLSLFVSPILIMLSSSSFAENEKHPFGRYSPCSFPLQMNDSMKNYYNDNGKQPGALFAFRLGLRTDSIYIEESEDEMSKIPKTINDVKNRTAMKMCRPSKAELIDEIMRRRRLELQQTSTELDVSYHPYPHLDCFGGMKKVAGLKDIWQLNENELTDILEKRMAYPNGIEGDTEETTDDIEFMKDEIEKWVKKSNEEQNIALEKSND